MQDWLEPTHEIDSAEAVEKSANSVMEFTAGKHEAIATGYKVYDSRDDANKSYLSLLLKGNEHTASKGMSMFKNLGFQGSPQKYTFQIMENGNIDSRGTTFGSPCNYKQFLHRLGEALMGKYFSITVAMEKRPQSGHTPKLEIQWVNRSGGYHQMNPRTTCAETEQRIINHVQNNSTQPIAQANAAQMTQPAAQQQVAQNPQAQVSTQVQQPQQNYWD